LPGCAAIIEQPEDGGPPQLYCTRDHRAAARRLRSIARFDAQPAPAEVAIARTGAIMPFPPVPPQGSLPTWVADPFSIPTSG
jgi:hypothetical protein